VDLKQAREEIAKQKSKLQELELNFKKKLQTEIDNFKKDVLEDILNNIKKYIHILAKESESIQVIPLISNLNPIEYYFTQ
jgi:hypothetical protein